METLRWKASYSVDVAELDLQHERLFRTVAELERALATGSADTIINESLQKAFVGRSHLTFSGTLLTI